MIAYTEFVDFLARGTSPQEIIDYRPSDEVQARVFYLLAQNRAQQLSEAEASELSIETGVVPGGVHGGHHYL